MNSRALAMIGVLVALLSGWMVVTLVQKPKAASAPKAAIESRTNGGSGADGLELKKGVSGNIETTTTVPVNQVETSVQIKK